MAPSPTVHSAQDPGASLDRDEERRWWRRGRVVRGKAAGDKPPRPLSIGWPGDTSLREKALRERLVPPPMPSRGEDPPVHPPKSRRGSRNGGRIMAGGPQSRPQSQPGQPYLGRLHGLHKISPPTSSRQVVVKVLSWGKSNAAARRMLDYIARAHLDDPKSNPAQVVRGVEPGARLRPLRPVLHDGCGIPITLDEARRAQRRELIEDGWGLVPDSANLSPAARRASPAERAIMSEQERLRLRQVVHLTISLGSSVTNPTETIGSRWGIDRADAMALRDRVALAATVHQVVMDGFVSRGYPVIWAIHDDHGRSHAHLLVGARSRTGQRLRLDRQELQALRYMTAETARTLGVPAIASGRYEGPLPPGGVRRDLPTDRLITAKGRDFGRPQPAPQAGTTWRSVAVQCPTDSWEEIQARNPHFFKLRLLPERRQDFLPHGIALGQGDLRRRAPDWVARHGADVVRSDLEGMMQRIAESRTGERPFTLPRSRTPKADPVLPSPSQKSGQRAELIRQRSEALTHDYAQAIFRDPDASLARYRDLEAELEAGEGAAKLADWYLAHRPGVFGSLRAWPSRTVQSGLRRVLARRRQVIDQGTDRVTGRTRNDLQQGTHGVEPLAPPQSAPRRRPSRQPASRQINLALDAARAEMQRQPYHRSDMNNQELGDAIRRLTSVDRYRSRLATVLRDLDAVGAVPESLLPKPEVPTTAAPGKASEEDEWVPRPFDPRDPKSPAFVRASELREYWKPFMDELYPDRKQERQERARKGPVAPPAPPDPMVQHLERLSATILPEWRQQLARAERQLDQWRGDPDRWLVEGAGGYAPRREAGHGGQVASGTGTRTTGPSWSRDGGRDDR